MDRLDTKKGGILIYRSFTINKKENRTLIIQKINKSDPISIYANEDLIDTIQDIEALRLGKYYDIQNDILFIQIKGKNPNKIYASVNTQKLKATRNDPFINFSATIQILYFIAVLNIILGIINLIFPNGFFAEFGEPISMLLYGIIFLFLGLIIHFKKSSIALITALILFLTDTILIIYNGITTIQDISPGIMFTRILFLTSMFRGVSALKKYKKMKSESSVANNQS